MSKAFFSGCHSAKLDEKNRFVLPQNLRYQLVENGALEFTIALGLGGCLAIYQKSEIEKIVESFRKKQHIAKYQKFFTLFFSTLTHATCDKVGRVSLPSVLKNGAGIGQELVIAGAMNKIELWPKEVYDRNLADLMNGEESEDLSEMMKEAFAAISEEESSDSPSVEEAVAKVQAEAVKL